jgi:mevalonate kinase
LETYRVPGKLLLTAEYVVLRGVTALAVPTRQGQELRRYPPPGDQSCFLHWIAYDQAGRDWLDIRFGPRLEIQKASDSQAAKQLQLLLRYAARYGTFPQEPFRVETHLQFDRSWGLGSSSTLVALIARLTHCDALNLHRHAYPGSGYDVATAMEGRALKYKLAEGRPQWRPFLPPSVWQDTFLVYRGRKQDSQAEVGRFKDTNVPDTTLKRLNELSLGLTGQMNVNQLAALLQEHEELLSPVLQHQIVQQDYPDCPAQLKSLGAWGGDFMWAVPRAPGQKEAVRRYFEAQPEVQIFPFSAIAAT